MGPSGPMVRECSSLATGAPASVVVGFGDLSFMHSSTDDIQNRDAAGGFRRRRTLRPDQAIESIRPTPCVLYAPAKIMGFRQCAMRRPLHFASATNFLAGTSNSSSP